MNKKVNKNAQKIFMAFYLYDLIGFPQEFYQNSHGITFPLMCQ